ncbi:hypothetical protein [Anditalea andensis]|uniref:Outer membrane protein beta-barrel domain-containing protein n=1 Tax=Anditalea andensis TaxID=1048983 RepID=A0A074KU20_9BACT|nr:hypothetical protein [Anditalea andensis]KEO73476.1 hypothetical protein EL17_11255 [Anditalea andensis]
MENNLKVSERIKERWGQQDRAFKFHGQTIYMDMIPMFQLFPAQHGGPTINLYAGAGIGIVHINNHQYRKVAQEVAEKQATVTSAYIPIRAAIGKKLNGTIELLLEGSFLGTFTDQLDGHVGKKYIKNDHLIQAQVAVKKLF